jgi:hypothetical protein
MGAFYLGAPWPVHNAAKAQQHFTAARLQSPQCRRNNYYCGLEALRAGRLDEARHHFETAVTVKCTTVEEEDISAFLLAQSKAALASINSSSSSSSRKV